MSISLGVRVGMRWYRFGRETSEIPTLGCRHRRLGRVDARRLLRAVPRSGRLWRAAVTGDYRPYMKIADVLRNKGEGVVTIGPDDTVARLLELLDERGIGAVVVSRDGSDVAGIVSERDVVRHLHRSGPDIVGGPVSAIMTSEVTTAGRDTDLEQLARTMTEKRIRHVPVVIEGSLHSIVSIGDVVKFRIDSLQSERDQLVGYIQQ